jgi:hypothetical protein
MSQKIEQQSFSSGDRGLFTALMALVIGMVFTVPSLFANQITVVPGFGPWQEGSGGEFTVVADAGVAAQLGAYSPFTMNQGGYGGSFQTFCMERNEYITANTTYDVTFNNVTVFSGDPLSAGAAYLYQQFATGQLYYNYANNPSFNGFPGLQTRNAGLLYSAYYLQNALWYLMNPAQYSGQASNPYVLQADAALGGSAASFAPDNGAHGVSILNLWAPGQPHDPQHAYQDVLVYAPVPEPGTLALLSLAGLVAFRRRK